jgi:2-methylcitrate dehydratase PrpD
VRPSDIPSEVLDRARLQVASVLGAVFAGASGDVGPKVRRAAARWGSGEDASLIPTGERVPLHAACYANAAASIAFDYDDYLFAGHTGHSAVLGSLAFGESLGASGADVIAAQVVANEVGGRLGAAMLLGPHNGQMWTYIHAIEGACVAGRFLGLDADALTHAIGIALAQPPYPLAPAFFGPDSKTLLASGPLVEGIRAAELAAEGLTGAGDILGDPNGLLAKIGVRPLPFVFGGLGSAWVTSSLAYKLYPGCAYVDTPVDAFDEIREAFSTKTGRALSVADVKSVRVEATLFTAGMEALATPYRSRERVTPIDVNFSVGMSFGVMLACGEISGETLSARSLAEHRDEILSVADRVTVEQAGDLSMDVGGLSDLGIDPARMFAGDPSLSLDGADFSKFEMRFPARVALETTGGEEFTAEVRIPAGAPGRPFEETRTAVGEKFLRGARAWLRDPDGALEAVLTIDASADARAIVERIVAR